MLLSHGAEAVTAIYHCTSKKLLDVFLLTCVFLFCDIIITVPSIGAGSCFLFCVFIVIQQYCMPSSNAFSMPLIHCTCIYLCHSFGPSILCHTGTVAGNSCCSLWDCHDAASPFMPYLGSKSPLHVELLGQAVSAQGSSTTCRKIVLNLTLSIHMYLSMCP
jgi:hypothetical protein